MLKVNLIVVSGKPEGKVIPLALPVFRIGRDETCHLRPNSVEVSRQHTEITVTDTTVTVRDLGSRNGTLVNGNLLNGSHQLKSGELLKVGPLTFAVSIQDPANTAAAPASSPSIPAAAPRVAALDDMPKGQIESWLVADNARPTPDRPSGVYDGDTLTIDAYTGSGGHVPGRPAAAPRPPSSASQPVARPPSSVSQPVARPPSSSSQPVARPSSSASQPVAKPPSPPTVPAAKPEPAARGNSYADEDMEFERLEEGVGDVEEETGDPAETDEGEEAEEEAAEFLDESNPFFIAKKPKVVEEAAKPAYKDTSDAANDILRKMLERRRGSR